jgi:hypothetical protein
MRVSWLDVEVTWTAGADRVSRQVDGKIVISR